MFDYLDSFARMCSLWSGGDVAAYGRQRLSRPHRSDRKKKGQRAKAQRRAKGKRRKL